MIAIQRKLFVHPAEQVRDPRTQPGGQRPAGGGRGTPQPVARWRGPRNAVAPQRDACGHPPAGQPVGHGRRRTASDTGKMNASSSAVVAPASTELTTPAKITPNPATAIEAAASHAVCEASVARQTNTPPVTASAALRREPFRHGAAEIDQDNIAKDPKRAQRSQLRVADDLSPKANRAGMMMRCPGGTAQCGEAAVALAEPPRGAASAAAAYPACAPALHI